jgi:hypothetical protein
VTLILGLLFGAIGSGYLLYAKRTGSGSFAIAGVLLIVFTYFVSGALLTFIVGALFTAIPGLVARFG